MNSLPIALSLDKKKMEAAGFWAASCSQALDDAYAKFVEDMRDCEDPEQLVYLSLSIAELRFVVPDTADWLVMSVQAQLLEERTDQAAATAKARRI